MQIPPALRQAIEQELASSDGAALRAAAARLSECYRGSLTSSASALAASGNTAFRPNALSTDLQRAAYLAVRLPATFAAAAAALAWSAECCNLEPRTVLDLGSGPGSALWAAAQLFPTLEAATAFERDHRLIEIARRLAARAPHIALSQAAWLQGDLTANIPEGAWELVLCSYALNELPAAQRSEFIRKAWARTGNLLVVIEPGTKAGFANILAVRARLLAEGATLVAPCPNALACPMAAGDDWCHFAARVERTAEHRRLKEATLGHEDEKFCYVAFSRNALWRTALSRNAFPHSEAPDEAPSAGARIVRHPRIFSGYTQLTLCRQGEIAPTTVTRSMKEDWRRLKHLGWGDRW
jgi:ribosomal protein RSM22 (predicted rRNA methylase)